MNEFIVGAIVPSYLVVGVFFLRFQRRISDSLFAIVALAGNGAIVTLPGIEREAHCCLPAPRRRLHADHRGDRPEELPRRSWVDPHIAEINP